MTQIIFQPTDLWDNGYSANLGGYFAASSMARAVLITSARIVDVVFNTSSVWLPHIGFKINGKDYTAIVPTQAGTNTIKCLLPKGQNKILEIIAGPQTATSGGGPVFTSNLISASFDAAARLIPPISNNRLLIYGDSIASGASADIGCLQGWNALLRFEYRGSIMIEAYGFRRLFDDANTAIKRTDFANKLASFGLSKIWFAIGTNDYGVVNSWNAANFGVAYADLLDKFRTASPSTKIYCQSPLARSTEPANPVYANVLEDYRAQIQAATSTRPWSIFIDGKTLVPIAQLKDGLHPNTAGHLTYKNAVLAVLNNT